LSEKDAQEIVRALSHAFLNERFVVPTKKSENANIDPYTERGFAGFDQMTPWSPMKR
jgi:nitrate reductase beta subunit